MDAKHGEGTCAKELWDYIKASFILASQRLHLTQFVMFLATYTSSVYLYLRHKDHLFGISRLSCIRPAGEEFP